MKFRNLLTAALLLLAVNVQADSLGENPFGFKMGMSEEEVKALEGVTVDSSRAWYNHRLAILSKVPHPHPLFATYHLYFSKKHGLFRINAWSGDIEIGKGGQNIMPKYIELREELVKRYNGYTRSAYIEGGAAWEMPSDWLIRVLKNNPRKDRQAFISEWSPAHSKRSEQLGHIELLIYLNKPANFLLTYDFTNWFQAKQDALR